MVSYWCFENATEQYLDVCIRLKAVIQRLNFFDARLSFVIKGHIHAGVDYYMKIKRADF